MLALGGNIFGQWSKMPPVIRQVLHLWHKHPKKWMEGWAGPAYILPIVCNSVIIFPAQMRWLNSLSNLNQITWVNSLEVEYLTHHCLHHCYAVIILIISSWGLSVRFTSDLWSHLIQCPQKIALPLGKHRSKMLRRFIRNVELLWGVCHAGEGAQGQE